MFEINDKVRYKDITELGSEYKFTKHGNDIIEIINTKNNEKIYQPIISLLGQETTIVDISEEGYKTSLLPEINTPTWVLDNLNKIKDVINLKSLIKSNRTHYIKLPITKNMSLRYHFTFFSNKHLEGKWILKFHAESYFQEIEDKLAVFMVKEHKIKNYEEIIGIQNGKEFNKIIVNNGNIDDLSILKE